LGWQPTVLTLRVIALLGMGLSLIALLIFAWYVFDKARQSQEALIRLKYGALLVDVYEQSLDPTSRIIDVTSMDDLAKLAERQNTMILHMTLNFLHYYLVQSNGTTYRYVISSGKRGATDAETTPDEPLDYTPVPAKESFTKTEPVWEEIPIYKIDRPKNNPVEAEPIREEIAEHKVTIAEESKNKVEPASKEITGYMIDAENSDFIPEKPIHTKNESSAEEDDNFDDDTPIQKEMLRYVFGPYRNNNEDKKIGNGK
jgi:hypothetical protein